MSLLQENHIFVEGYSSFAKLQKWLELGSFEDEGATCQPVEQWLQDIRQAMTTKNVCALARATLNGSHPQKCITRQQEVFNCLAFRPRANIIVDYRRRNFRRFWPKLGTGLSRS